MKATNKILAAFAVLLVMAMGAGFAVNVNGAIVNALTGFQFNGAAPSGHVLCGNGSVYVDSASCGTSANYQAIQINGAGFTPRAILNFDTNFTGADTSPSTTIHLASSINVNAATATSAATAAALSATPTQCGGGTPIATGIAANGNANCAPAPSPSRTCNGNGCYVQYSDGTVVEWGTVGGCSTSGAGCTVSVTLPLSISNPASSSVSATCKSGPTNCMGAFTSLGNTGFSFVYNAAVRVGGSGGELTGTQSGAWILVGF